MSHWTHNNEPFLDTPEDKVGFVYCITNILTGKKYIGKKSYWSKVTKKPLKGKNRKRHSRKESDWKTYCSSSKYLKEDIDLIGIENFAFEILEQFTNKSSLNFAELKLQIYWDVLDAKLDCGDRAFYNENINLRTYASSSKEMLLERQVFDEKYNTKGVYR
jgi:hypothetical protein